MRLLNGLRERAAEKTMLEIERMRHQPTRGFVYASVGAAAAILVAVWAYDASGSAMNQRPTIQRATAY